ncbi:MAG TPA: hypothetical protein VLA15_06965, partial [Desulfurivibrionaceae bacterium]|nr:hypothetical protein [Desulfurivibrionaceae bacterium]
LVLLSVALLSRPHLVSVPGLLLALHLLGAPRALFQVMAALALLPPAAWLYWQVLRHPGAPAKVLHLLLEVLVLPLQPLQSLGQYLVEHHPRVLVYLAQRIPVYRPPPQEWDLEPATPLEEQQRRWEELLRPLE